MADLTNSVIFIDFGGTLADTLAASQVVFGEFFGRDFSRNEIAEIFIDSATMSGFRVARKHKLSIFKWITQSKRFRQLRKKLFFTNTEAYPHALQFLQQLRQQYEGKMILLTRNPLFSDPETSIRYLQACDLDFKFDDIAFTEDKSETLKQYMSVHVPDYAVILGDLLNDADSARDNGVQAILVNWGYCMHEDLPDDQILVNSFEELSNKLAELFDQWRLHSKQAEELFGLSESHQRP